MLRTVALVSVSRGRQLVLTSASTATLAHRLLPTSSGSSGVLEVKRWLSSNSSDDNSGPPASLRRPPAASLGSVEEEMDKPDPLKLFIEKRKQSTAQQGRQYQQGDRNQRNNNANFHSRNTNSNHQNRNQNNQNISSSNSNSNSQHIPNQNQYQNNRDPNNRNSHHRRNQNNENQNNSNYRQNNRQPRRQYPNQNQNRNTGPTSPNQQKKDRRLSDLINELRKNSDKSNAVAAAAAASNSDNQSNNRGASAPPLPSWRQKFVPDASSDNGKGGSMGALPRFPRPLFPRGGGGGADLGEQQPEDHMGRRQQRQAKRTANRQQNDVDGIGFLSRRRTPESESAGNDKARIEDTARTVTLPGDGAALTLSDTSILFRIKIEDIQSKLRSMEMPYKNNKGDKEEITLDVDTLELLALEYGIETERGDASVVVDTEELLLQNRRVDDDVELRNLPPRSPVVCIMGHVDHGKTTLMDALRRMSLAQEDPKSKKKVKSKKGKKNDGSEAASDMAGTEAGGITQIISAFQVDVEGQDNKVTFLDTPGHAAFKSMRQSGSHAADVIVLVVAADDGVSEQTIEILDFYKSIVKGSDGGIAMVVALNKIDKPGIDVDEAQMRIENQLLEQGIISEGMNGDSEFGPPVQVIPTSGLTGHGLDDLMEGLILQSEVMDLRADDKTHGEGIVMDARLEKGLGVVADCIIRWGSMQKGDCIVSGTQASRIRMLKDVNGKMLDRGIPSQPVRIVGFKSLPRAGDPIICVESDDIAEEMAEQRAAINVDDDRPDCPRDVEVHINGMRSRDTARAAKVHKLAAIVEGDGTIRIPIIVKADADGSLSAVRDSLLSLGGQSSYKVVIDPIQEGIGEITPTDILMAKESDACIFAFGLKRIDPAMLNMAEREGVTVRSNDIIYSLLDEAKITLGRYLPPQPVEHIHGRATVQAIFNIDGENGNEKVAGLKVTEGHFYRSKGPVEKKAIACHFRVFRDGEKISPKGEVVTASSLRRFKELVESVRLGDECGLGLEGFTEFVEDDEIECYSIEMRSGSL